MVEVRAPPRFSPGHLMAEGRNLGAACVSTFWPRETCDFYQTVNNAEEEHTFFSLRRKECGEKWVVFILVSVCFLSAGNGR